MFAGKAGYPVARVQYRSYLIAPGKKFYNIGTWCQCYKAFFSANVAKLAKVIVLKVCLNFASEGRNFQEFGGLNLLPRYKHSSLF
jgi:hypothetical protein